MDLNLKIKKIELVSCTGEFSFDRKLERVVNKMQKDGLVVEIQFSTAMGEKNYQHTFSALVIGRG